MQGRLVGPANIENYFSNVNRGQIYGKAIEDIDRRLIEKALEYSFGNQLKAARMLGINRNTLHTKIKKINIDVEKFK